MNAQQKRDTKAIAELLNTLVSTHAQFTQISADQSGLGKNQVRVYRDYGDFERDYFIITVRPDNRRV